MLSILLPRCSVASIVWVCSRKAVSMSFCSGSRGGGFEDGFEGVVEVASSTIVETCLSCMIHCVVERGTEMLVQLIVLVPKSSNESVIKKKA